MMTDFILQLLDALVSNGVEFFDDLGDDASEQPDGTMYRAHAHPRCEIILRLEGSLRILCGEHWLHLDDDRPRVFLPGVFHSEGFCDPQTSYRLLWCCQLPGGINLHATQYEPGRGFSVSASRTIILNPRVSELWNLVSTPSFSTDILKKANFTGTLIEILADYALHREEKRQPTKVYREQVIGQIREYIAHHSAEPISLERLATMVGYSSGHLNVLFRKFTGKSLHQHLLEVRLNRARELLESGAYLVSQAAESVGFEDPLYFSKVFRRRFGLKPTEIARHSPRNPQDVIRGMP